MPEGAPAPRRGKIASFDDHRGLGEVEGVVPDEAVGRRYPFHCTQIADGTRTIVVGTAVTFEVAPGPLGPEEAVAIVKL